MSRDNTGNTREFHYREGFMEPKSEQDDFINYINTLAGSQDQKPFGCPNLVVLTQPVKLVFPDRPSKNYEEGALMCVYHTVNTTGERCRVDSSLKKGNEGLIFVCKIAGLEFEVNIADVRKTR